MLDCLGEIIEHPSNVFAILGKSLPNVVGYFTTFIMTKILAGLPMILLRTGALLRLIFLKLCFREKCLTQAELDEIYHCGKFATLWYGWEVRFTIDVKYFLPCRMNFYVHLYTFSFCRINCSKRKVPKSPLSDSCLFHVFLYLSHHLPSGDTLLPWCMAYLQKANTCCLPTYI